MKALGIQRFMPLLAALALACGGGAVTPPGGDTAPVTPAVYAPGNTYFGASNYVEYVAGNLPVVFSAPHGGALTPAEIPDRTAAACGGEATTGRDLNTAELARAVQAAFFERTGRYPHVVIAHLHRRKLDANRPLAEAACGNTAAGKAFAEYHEFIEVAKARILADHGKGWYTDLHGHGHPIQRLELGYLLESDDLRLSDETLDASVAYENESSIKVFSQQLPMSFSALLRGPASLGTLLATAGYPSVPGGQDTHPDTTEAYLSGGYSTERHGCSGGGAVCGVQIEHNMTNVRDTEASRAAYAAALTTVYEQYLAQFGIVLPRR
ncbi:MAG TPA: hypothetical protein VFO66_03905 [Gemmatimonadaceae bacterium]|nr:hypothetical protein [Gemmatimonadaceae bacterium]